MGEREGGVLFERKMFHGWDYEIVEESGGGYPGMGPDLQVLQLLYNNGLRERSRRPIHEEDLQALQRFAGTP